MDRADAKWMINEMKYDGFRYDYCKGFHNSHIGDYNKVAGAYFSVMEYWDGNAGVLWSRIQDAGCNTLTFDFGVKYEALNRGIASGNYNGCKGPGLLGMGKGKYAVTFVDSHDSYQRDDNEFCGKGNSMKNKAKVLQANAFILSMPGVPCVFYPHWKEMKSEIGAMVLARKAVGVHSESSVQDEADGGGYRATVQGTNGYLILELGNKVSSSQSGYTKAASGSGYAMWIKTSSAMPPQLIVNPASMTYKTESLEVEMRAIGGTGTPGIYYTLDGSDPLTSATRQKYTAPITITGTKTLKAYAEANGSKSEVYTFTYTYKAPQTTPIVVSFAKPSHWDKVYLYSWTADAYPTGKWPGTEMTEINANGLYYHIFEPELKEINFIFNGGNGKEQTGDLWTDEDVCYGWQGGAEVLLPDCMPTDVENVEVEKIVPALDLTQPMYNILGQEVGADYHGIVIQNGNKYLKL